LSYNNPGKFSGRFLATCCAIIIGLCTSVMAQNAAGSSVHLSATPAAAATTGLTPQNVSATLANLPEADTMMYINLHRILNDAVARVLPEKDVAEMRQAFGDINKSVGVNPATVEYLVFQVRFKKPTPDLNFSLPEFMVVTSGDFSAEAMIKLAGEAMKGKMHSENYGSHEVGLVTIDEITKQAEKTPILKSLSEFAIVALNGNTIAVGTPAYVRAAIDSSAGKNRISPDLLNSVLRDSTALVSIAGSPWTAFAKTFALLGTEGNPRASKCDSKLGDFYAAITMDDASFKFRGAMNADNPDTAKIYKSLLTMLLQQANNMTTDKSAQSVLSSLVITPTDTEVLVQAEVSQQAVADFIRQQSMPKKQETTSPPETPAKRTPVRHRRTTRKTHPTT
jgi:hypothetical protein